MRLLLDFSGILPHCLCSAIRYISWSSGGELDWWVGGVTDWKKKNHPYLVLHHINSLQQYAETKLILNDKYIAVMKNQWDNALMTCISFSRHHMIWVKDNIIIFTYNCCWIKTNPSYMLETFTTGMWITNSVNTWLTKFLTRVIRDTERIHRLLIIGNELKHVGIHCQW